MDNTDDEHIAKLLDEAITVIQTLATCARSGAKPAPSLLAAASRARRELQALADRRNAPSPDTDAST